MRLEPIRSFAIGAAILGAVSSPIAASALGAQSGRTSTFVAGVADAETGQPLDGAEVILLGVHRLARANAMGEATLDQIPRGAQRVRVRKLGYAPSEVDIAMAGDTTGAVFRLQPSVTPLSAVKVEAAEWVPPQMKDVEVRRKQGIGHVLRDVDLDKDRDRDLPLVLTTRLPGLKTILDVQSSNRVLASTRDQLGLQGIAPCFVTLYLDGIDVPRQDIELVRTWDLAAVEYYTPEQVPVRYRTKFYACGVVLLWSKWY
jgi:hypothetical protein